MTPDTKDVCMNLLYAADDECREIDMDINDPIRIATDKARAYLEAASYMMNVQSELEKAIASVQAGVVAVPFEGEIS